MISPFASTWKVEDLPLLLALLPNFAPPPKLSVSAWAESNIVLPRGTNARAGELKLDPYQAQMIDRASAPDVRVAVFMLASQTGKSLSIDALLLDRIARRPGPMLHVSPTDGKTRAFVRERLDPLVRESPKLRGLFGTGRRGGDGDGLSYKAFSGGFLAMASSHKPDDLAARAIQVLFCDEVDRFAGSAGQEGDPVELAIKRQHTYRGKSLAVIASTPTDAHSRIAAWFDRGDQARFFVPCPHCGHWDWLQWDRLKWTPGKPETAHLTCSACAGRVYEDDRAEMLSLGEWRSTAETPEPGVLSFHANVLVSSFTTLPEVAQNAEAAEKGGDAKRRVFINTSRAEVYIPEGTQLDINALQNRAEPVPAILPAMVQYITAGVDVQGDRIELTALASAGGEQAVLDHRVFLGDTTGPEPWAKLDIALGTTFPHESGKSLGFDRIAVDSGYQASRVYEFCASQRSKGRKCHPVKGSAGFDKPTIKGGFKSPNNLTILHVGIDSIKEQICKRLSRSPQSPNGLHLPDHLDVAYFEGLSAEKLVTRYVRGKPRSEWKKEAKKNEPLDCLVYAIAICDLVRYKPSNDKVVNIADAASRLRDVSNSPRTRTV